MKLLAAVAVTALSGCVSVHPQPGAPPRPETSRPAHDLTPQSVGPPVHDTLEAEAKPSSPPSPAASRRAAPPPAARPGEPSVPRQRERQGPAHPRPRRVVPAAPAPTLPKPVTGADVCALGRGYGHWPAGSPQSRICDRAYGR